MIELDVTTQDEISGARLSSRIPYRALFLIGLGGLFNGVTGPLLNTFIPPLVRDAVGDHRTIIGAIMAIDNVLLLLLIPWTGPASDRAKARGRGRLPLVLGWVRAVVARHGAASLLICVRPPIPRWRDHRAAYRDQYSASAIPGIDGRCSAVAASVPRNRPMTFQMCVGAIAFLMLGRALGMRPAF